MRSRVYSILVTGAVVLALLTGCSGSNDNPAVPGLSDNTGDHYLNHHSTSLFGLWEISLNPDSNTADIVPLRTIEMTANVTQFMQPPYNANHMLGISIDDLQSDFPNGYVVVDVSFRHPFPGLDTYTGFDVRGACIGNASIDSEAVSGISYAGENDLRVLNADGYTRFFNPTEFTTYGTILGFTLGKLGTPNTSFDATLNGYKYFCDTIEQDESVIDFFDDPSCLNPRGYFTAGNQITRTYELQFPVSGGPVFQFQYAVVASWEEPTEAPPSIPDSFTLSANCQEAYAFSAADQSTLYFDGSGGGGELILDLAVLDHQGVAETGGVHDEIGAIHFESPDGLISSGYTTFTGLDLDTALLSSDDFSAQYHLSIPESLVDPMESGDFPILVIVESADPVDYDPGFPGFDYPDGPLAAYFMTTVHVGGENPNEPPVAVADTSSGTYTGFTDVPIEFTGEDSYDPDGIIVSWEWDSDGDGIYDDAEGEIVDLTFETEGTHFVDLKVTDDYGATDTLDTLIEIEIGGKVIHVDDDNAGDPSMDGTEAHPYDTIQKGIDAVPDDTGWMVYVHAGTYSNDVHYVDPGNVYTDGGMFWIEGLSNVVLKGEDGAIIDPGTMSGYVNIAVMRVLGDHTNITIENFEFKAGFVWEAAVYVSGGSDFIVQDCFIDGGHGYQAFLRANTVDTLTCQRITVENFRLGSTGGALYWIMNSSDVVLTETDTFNYSADENIYQSFSNFIYLYNLTTAEISKNKIGGEHHRQRSCTNYTESYGIRVYSGSNITIRNNLIYDSYFYNTNTSANTYNYGIYMTGSFTNVEIYNNTIDSIGPPASYNGLGAVRGIYVTTSNSVTVHSNIVTNITAPSSAAAYGINSAAAVSCEYGDVWSVTGGSGGLYGGGASAGTGSISANPMYYDPANFDYTLQSGSPCEGTGKDGYDMGCYGGSDPLEN